MKQVEKRELVVSRKAGTRASMNKRQNVKVTHERPSIVDEVLSDEWLTEYGSWRGKKDRKVQDAEEKG